MFDGMRIATLHHIERAGDLAMLRAAVVMTMELVLGCSPSDTFLMVVVSELAAEFQKAEDRCSWLEWPTMRICDLLLEPLPGQALLADCLDEANEWLRVELAAWREVDAELDAMRALAVQVRDSVLGDADGPSSLAASLSAAVELFEGRVNDVTVNRVHWAARSMLVANVLHFLELETDLEVLRSICSACLTEDEADVLWILVRTALDSLAMPVPSSVARDPPDDAIE
jgi:hypothetical protein